MTFTPKRDSHAYRGPERRDITMQAGAIADSWMPVLTKTGLAGIAVFLVWALQGAIRSDVTEIKTDLKAHMLASDERDKTSNERDAVLKSILNITVQQCVNSAATQGKRDACFVAVSFAPIRDPK